MSQKDIARSAGVSQSIVSHVINDSYEISISPETRKRVLKVIEEMGYVPNRAAQSLRSMQSNTVAVVVPDITNPFYPQFFRGVQDVVQAAGYDLLAYNTDGKRELEIQGLQAALRARVDGIIGTFFHVRLGDYISIVGDDQPGVMMRQIDPEESMEQAPVDFVSIDGPAAGRLVTDYLLSKGHRRIVMLSGTPLSPPRESRLRGYKEALADHDITFDESLILSGDFEEEAGYEAMQQVLRMDPLPTAVFAANDLMAIGAMRACNYAGLRVPEDIAIAGFDDIPAAPLLHPPLTTLNQNAHLTGTRCAQLLLDRLEGRYTNESRFEEIPVQLVVRKSA